jgi:hypothetical protein
MLAVCPQFHATAASQGIAVDLFIESIRSIHEREHVVAAED